MSVISRSDDSSSPKIEKRSKVGHPWFGLAFRPFFLLGASFSIVSVLLWALHMGGVVIFEPFGGAYWWHVHEMLFGFVAAIVCGFLLTAVQTWTQVPSISGKPLMLLVCLWLSARFFLIFPQWLPGLVVSSLDFLFLPVAAFYFARPIFKAKMWRNLIFVPVLLVMAFINGFMHWMVASDHIAYVPSAGQTMVLMVTLVMCIIGGRVFPMFTANGTQTPRVEAIAWLEKVSIISVVCSILLSLDFVNLPSIVNAVVYGVAGVANMMRCSRWRVWVTLKTPLVWSLHFSYWAMSLGLLMLALSELSIVITRSLAIHAITVGGMGMMILSMISRVSLGHTGRKIEAKPIMKWAFFIMILAFFARVFLPLVFPSYMFIIVVVALLWSLGYGVFVYVYAPILTRPRVDGLPG